MPSLMTLSKGTAQKRSDRVYTAELGNSTCTVIVPVAHGKKGFQQVSHNQGNVLEKVEAPILE